MNGLVAVDLTGFPGEALARVGLGALLGALIGLQREIDDQPAGLRTHLSVCMGAALFGVISTLGFDEFEARGSSTNQMVDVTRVASQVVVGVGFLGAGIIFRRGGAVRNLTTAASLWVTAGVGLAAGVGDPVVAAAGAMLLVVALGVLRGPRNLARRRFTRRIRVFRVGLAPDADPEGVLESVAELDDVEAVVVGAEKRAGRTELRIRIQGRPGVAPETCVQPLIRRDDVELVRFADEPPEE